jgi:hypothetical protein
MLARFAREFTEHGDGSAAISNVSAGTMEIQPFRYRMATMHAFADESSRRGCRRRILDACNFRLRNGEFAIGARYAPGVRVGTAARMTSSMAVADVWRQTSTTP